MRNRKFEAVLVSSLLVAFAAGGLASDNCEVRIVSLEKRIDALEKINEEKSNENEKLEKRLALVERYISLLKPQIEEQGRTKSCSSPQAPENAVAYHASLRQDADAEGGYTLSVELTCAPGYLGEGGKAECLIDGTWSKEFTCEEALVVISGGHARNELYEKTKMKSQLKAVEVIDFTSECQVSIPEMTMARYYHNLMYTNGELLACNGMHSQATCESWKPGQSSWKSHSRLPLDENEGLIGAGEFVSPLSGSGKGATYIFGGSIDKPDTGRLEVTKTIYSLEHGSHEWKKYGELNASRLGFCYITDSSSKLVLLIGGASNNVPTRNMSFLDVEGIGEENFHSLPEPVGGPGCALLPDGERLIVAGGFRLDENSSEMLDNVLIYEPDGSQNVTTGAPLNHARGGHKLVHDGESLYALGGIGANHQVLSSIEMYNSTTGEWELLDRQLAVGRANFAVTYIPRSWFPECQ